MALLLMAVSIIVCIGLLALAVFGAEWFGVLDGEVDWWP